MYVEVRQIVFHWLIIYLCLNSIGVDRWSLADGQFLPGDKIPAVPDFIGSISFRQLEDRNGIGQKDGGVFGSMDTFYPECHRFSRVVNLSLHRPAPESHFSSRQRYISRSGYAVGHLSVCLRPYRHLRWGGKVHGTDFVSRSDHSIAWIQLEFHRHFIQEDSIDKQE